MANAIEKFAKALRYPVTFSGNTAVSDSCGAAKKIIGYLRVRHLLEDLRTAFEEDTVLTSRFPGNAHRPSMIDKPVGPLYPNLAGD